MQFSSSEIRLYRRKIGFSAQFSDMKSMHCAELPPEYCLRVAGGERVLMSVEAMLQNMIDELSDALKDAAKHDKGQKAAGTRVRKVMQGIKSAAQDVRKQVQNDRS